MANNTVTVCFFLLLVVWKSVCKYKLSGNPSFAVVGDNITLIITCTADDKKNYVKWYDNAARYTDFDLIAEIKPVCDISIKIERDGYFYTCNIPEEEYFLTIPFGNVNENLEKIQWSCIGAIGPRSDNWNLIIGVPVTSLNITPAGKDNVINVLEYETCNFTCTTNPSKPVALIDWYIDKLNLTNQTSTQTQMSDGDKFIYYSKLVYTGEDADHKKSIYCEASNIEGRPKVKSIKKIIYVKVPVNNLSISPAGEKDIVHVVEGNNVTFTCTTVSSRPVAWILWYIGGKDETKRALLNIIQQDRDKAIANSTLTYTGNNDDHNKTIHCEAANIEGTATIKSIVKYIAIKVPVTTLTITPAGVRNFTYIVKGEIQDFKCSTDLCRPAAAIQWYIAGRNVTNEAQLQIAQEDEKELFKSTSTLHYIGNNSDHMKMIHCETANIEDSNKVQSTSKVIYLQVPVTHVSISPAGTNNIINVVKSKTQNFSCTTGFSRPAAWIQWYIGKRNVTEQSQLQITQTGDSSNASSILNYTGNNDDHEQHIYCKAVNIEGRTKVNSTKLKIYILIPVTEVSITPSSESNVIDVVEEMTQNFICTTNSNRPAASIKWYIGKLDITLESYENTTHQSAEMFTTFSILMYKGKDADHNKTVYCEAINIEGRYKVPSIYKYLYIQFGPKITTLDPPRNGYEVTENKSLDKIMCSAKCRPHCNYSWNGPNSYRNLKSDLQFDSIYRNQSGIYFCIARNTFGSLESKHITITVNYPPTILQLHNLNNNTTHEHSSVILQCGVDSHPASDISWNFIRSNTNLLTSQNVLQSNFSISEAKCVDTGTYQCQATNVINSTSMVDTKRINLFVRCSSRRDNRRPNENNEIGLGDGDILNITVYLIAYPPPSIYWTFIEENTVQNVSVDSNNSFNVFEHHSNLQKLHIEEHDFGVYTIHASNNIGKEYIREFIVSGQRRPNPPTNISVTCSVISMTVYWRSEYNGGDTQNFKVLFINPVTNNSVYSDVILDEGKDNNRNFKAESLNPNTVYLVFVKATNNHGTVISTDYDNCTTDAVSKKEELVSLTGVVIGGVLGLVCAVVLVAATVIIVRQRRSKKEDTKPIRRNLNELDDEHDDEDGLKDNPLYATSGNAPDGGQIYSQVMKAKKKPTSAKKDESAIYSQVNKTDNTGKHGRKDNKTGKGGIQSNVIELGSVYENSEKTVKTTSDDVYANTSEPFAEGQNRAICRPPKQSRNKDGLVYADLVFNSSLNGPTFIHGIDDRTIYADVDTTQKIDPLPDNDEEDTNENENMTNDQHVN